MPFHPLPVSCTHLRLPSLHEPRLRLNITLSDLLKNKGVGAATSHSSTRQLSLSPPEAGRATRDVPCRLFHQVNMIKEAISRPDGPTCVGYVSVNTE